MEIIEMLTDPFFWGAIVFAALSIFGSSSSDDDDNDDDFIFKNGVNRGLMDFEDDDDYKFYDED
jgi:hypothetical protein